MTSEDIERGTDQPLYAQIAGILRRRIRSGQIPPRYPLPSKRALRQEYGLADGTVSKAMRLLADEGLVRSVRGLGIFVRPEADWADPPS